jgi:hypothetical protein
LGLEWWGAAPPTPHLIPPICNPFLFISFGRLQPKQKLISLSVDQVMYKSK